MMGMIVLLTVGCGVDQPLNLVIVMVDTLRADHLEFQGYERQVAPHLTELADRSVVLLNHHAHASRTGPSVASLLTGLHPPSHGVVNPLTHFVAKGVLADEVTTLAEILRQANFECHGVVTNPNVSARFGFSQGFDSYEYLEILTAEEVNRHAAVLLQNTTSPFFLYLHYLEPHSPYDAPPAYRDRWVDSTYGGVFDGSHAQLDEVVAGTLIMDESDQAQLEALYDREIAYFDHQLGELLDLLESRGLAENTILVVVADHGEEFGDHGSALHGYTLYEEQLHVPCLIYDPRRVEPQRIEAITRNVDMAPTLLAQLGVSWGGPFQGEDLSPMLDGGAEGDPLEVYAHASLRAVRIVEASSYSVNGWKYIAHTLPEAREELFDLHTDPLERRNLILENPIRAEEMRHGLEAMVQTMPVVEGGVVQLTPEEQRRLKALGYLE
jgi:arylsulfatase A-like enzyme